MIARLIYRFALLIVGVWAFAAVAGNSLAPPLERVVADLDQPFLPVGTATSLAVQRSAAAFSQAPTDNVGYLVLERDGRLTDQDRAYYDQVVAALRADTQHVYEVTDWWRMPAAADTAVSRDGDVVTATLRLDGMTGSTEAIDSITAARTIVSGVRPPDGLHVYITGAGATIMDEFAAIDRQTQVITAVTLGVLLIFLVIMYRSLITAMVPLVSVMSGLTVAKPVISDLASRQVISVSLFSLSIAVAVAVGAGAGFAIFLIGRYHEQRRNGADPADALADAYRSVAPAIVGSTLIVVAPLAAVGWLSLARISMFATTGILCAIGVLTVGIASLTLTPALIALASRAGLMKPPRLERMRRRWRRIGTHVARWPAPILVAGSVFVLIMLLALPGVPIGWDETASTSPDTEANRGYRAVNQHFDANHVQPDVVTIESDEDLRNPAALTAIGRVTGAIMGITGVRMVQSASHPGGMVSKQASLSATGGNVGDRLDQFADLLAAKNSVFTDLDAAVRELGSGLDLVQSSTTAGAYAIGGVSLAVRLTQQATDKIRARAADVGEIFDPLRSFVGSISDCRTTPVCSSAQEAVQWATAVVAGANKLVEATDELAKATVDAASAPGVPLPAVVANVSSEMAQVRGMAAQLREQLGEPRPVPTQELPDYLRRLAAASQGSPGANLYASRRILTDPGMRPTLDQFFSPNGHATRLFVYGQGLEWGDEGAARARAIEAAVTDTIKGDTLKVTAVELTGVGPATRDLQDIVGGDLALMVVITLGVILFIAALLLRSPIAGFVVLATILVSYVCALGASVLLYHRLLHHDLHWSVPPIAFVSMVGIASGGNLLFALRIREGLSAGLRTSIIRASAATGMVVTAGGVVVGLTMLALGISSVLSVAQIGVTVGLGLVLNALVVRAFVLPATMVVLDRWLWWPRRSAADDEELEPAIAAR
ncbi:RND family transporter [Mycobacterium sp. TY815]|uniref:MMPL/RND family transporter n=1 Tax=Mycobacterium sp. TY815 TaxID=3050581 RepID=UPI0027427736|nr:RND family transporter [Mycobacterium sp. TY815]MDP7702047.1 RND family transporter [Mycobacterium sp. TY815]